MPRSMARPRIDALDQNIAQAAEDHSRARGREGLVGDPHGRGRRDRSIARAEHRRCEAEVPRAGARGHSRLRQARRLRVREGDGQARREAHPRQRRRARQGRDVRAKPKPPVASTIDQADDAYDDANYIGALKLAELVLAKDPKNADALRLAARAACGASNAAKAREYIAKLPPADRKLPQSVCNMNQGRARPAGPATTATATAAEAGSREATSRASARCHQGARVRAVVDARRRTSRTGCRARRRSSRSNPTTERRCDMRASPRVAFTSTTSRRTSSPSVHRARWSWRSARPVATRLSISLLALALVAVRWPRNTRTTTRRTKPDARVLRDATPADRGGSRRAPSTRRSSSSTTVTPRIVPSTARVVLDAADIGFARYTRFGQPTPRWQLGKVIDGERAACRPSASPRSTCHCRTSKSRPRRSRCACTARPKQSVTVKVNGRKPGKQATVKLEAGWQTVALQVDPGHLGVGENQLTFETTGGKSRIAVAWLRIGTIHPAGDSDPRIAASFDAKADTIELAQNAEGRVVRHDPRRREPRRGCRGAGVTSRSRRAPATTA